MFMLAISRRRQPKQADGAQLWVVSRVHAPRVIRKDAVARGSEDCYFEPAKSQF